VFNVVIEKELDLNNDPLIIKEDINEIVQSIEEQLYNINVSYRNHVRKIKNNIKSLEGVSESTFIILEDDNINDDNLIYYLTNVLEISLDCVVATLCESREFKPQLSTVNSLSDLLQIDHSNIKVCNQIIENCKELFNIYSEVNDKKLSSTSFYEILDESITRSVKRNIFETITVEDSLENKIYNLVIENLDILVDSDLVATYDNIKLFAVSINEARNPQPMGQQQAQQQNPPGHVPLPPNANWFDRLINYFVDNMNANRMLAIFGALGLGSYFISRIIEFVGDILKNGIGWFDNLNLGANIDLIKDPNVKAILKKLEILDNQENSIFNLKNMIKFKGPFSSDNPVAPLLSEQEINIINNYVDTIKNYKDASLELMVIQKTITKYGGSLGMNGTGVSNLEYLHSSIKSLKSEHDAIQTNNNSLTTGVMEKTAKLADLKNQIKLKEATIELMEESYKATKQLRDNLQSNLENVQSLIANSGFISAGLAGSVFVLLLIGAYLLKRATFTDNSLSTLKTILVLRKKIDELRKNILGTFPELKVQFTFIDSEVKKCEQESARKNDIVQAYKCSMKYFMGSYALIMYSTLLQFVKDGGNLHSFNKLSDVHSYRGFATMTTRQLINKLNEFYSLMIDYDATMNDAFESIFYLMKKQILENRGSDNILKQLPNNLSMGQA
jgi:hypothetical protein